MKKTLIPLLIFVALLIVASILYVSTTKYNTKDNKEIKESPTIVTETTQEQSQPKKYSENSKISNIPISEDELSEKATVNIDYLPALIGVNEGTATIIVSSFVFPSSTFNVKDTKQFELNADGFDLSVLNNKDLEIEEGVYPELGVIMSGIIAEKNGEFTLTIDSLTPEFHTKDKESPLNNDTSLKILSNLEKTGLEFPVTSKSNPLIIPVEIDYNSEFNYTLKSKDGSKLFFNYSSKVK